MESLLQINGVYIYFATHQTMECIYTHQTMIRIFYTHNTLEFIPRQPTRASQQVLKYSSRLRNSSSVSLFCFLIPFSYSVFLFLFLIIHILIQITKKIKLFFYLQWTILVAFEPHWRAFSREFCLCSLIFGYFDSMKQIRISKHYFDILMK